MGGLMIGFENCTKEFRLDNDHRVILDAATLMFDPSDRVCVLGTPSSGKTTVANLLSGFGRPTAGQVQRSGRISWPLGFAGAFHPAMTGARNIEIIADLAEAPRNWVSAYVAEFSELGDDYYRPLETYSSSMRSRLGFALSMAIPADTYVVDGSVGSGSPAYRAKCEVAFEQKLDKAGMFFVTHSPRIAEKFGRRFALLKDGDFVLTEDFSAAEKAFEEQLVEQDDLRLLVEGFAND